MTKNLWQMDRNEIFRDLVDQYLDEGYSKKEARKLAKQEADEIMELFPDRSVSDFVVNLRGHGSLALVDDVEKLKALPYKPREVPDIHEYDLE